ncbi:hypothetical protein MAMC_00732 [Methylacidimicrobium cyclopophantes]|uniref:Uncharacterized protein n=1 Tax=Methylacidimicrobium cyclopophantes TaxID=1041766 RepID=A0A5E6MBF4_9BACT|nr:hypothetical protein [Methylacidimicrobium cyclopophantes]VVM05649.1 hypothetical protein MAMC_00732 [Methylacidimicrobium cyclopophantes]
MATEHACDETKEERGRKGAGTTGSLSLRAFWSAAFLLALPVIGVSVVTRNLTRAETQEANQALAQRVALLQSVRDADRQTLGSYRWIDRSKGIVALPIERAMELEEERLKAKPVAPSSALLPGALLRQAPSPTSKP